MIGPHANNGLLISVTPLGHFITQLSKHQVPATNGRDPIDLESRDEGRSTPLFLQ